MNAFPDGNAFTSSVEYTFTSVDEESPARQGAEKMPVVMSATYELLFLVQPDAEIGGEDLKLYMAHYCPIFAYPYWRLFAKSTIDSLGYPRFNFPPLDTLDDKHIKGPTQGKTKKRPKKVTAGRRKAKKKARNSQ